jgi:DNA-binding LytR/AlgR family response regulator
MISCIALDDESLALDLLEDNIRQIPFLQLVKRCSDVFEAIDILQKEKIYLIFLDIQMPGLTGIQFLKTLTGQHKPMIIFVTAYDHYALEGFNLDVLDYLLKPVSFERFLKAANKALDYAEVRKKSEDIGSERYFFVHSEYNLVKVDTQEITHIEGLKDYIKIHLQVGGRPIITRMSIKSMEERLPSTKFLRIHKSFIVNIDRIISIRKNRIRTLHAEIPIGDSYSEELNKLINKSSAN